MRRITRALSTLYERAALQSEEFVIVSNNCWGFEAYKTLKRSYNTPFVGLFLFPEDYLKLLQHFDQLKDEPLAFIQRSRHLKDDPDYPVGLLFDDVEIHFLHYSSKEEASNKWNRRVNRMTEALFTGAKPVFKMCDRDGGTSGHLQQFHEIPTIKEATHISFGVNEINSPYHLTLQSSQVREETQAVDGLKLYQQRYQLFDFPKWVKSGTTRRSLIAQIISILC